MTSSPVPKAATKMATPEQMAARIQELEQQLAAALQAAPDSSNPGANSNPGVSSNPAASSSAERKEVVYVHQDRKMSKFSGRLDKSDSLTVDEWIDEMDTYVSSKPISEKEKAQLIYNQLEGAARIEIKFSPVQTKQSVQGIFDVLREVYGCLHSHVSLQRRFFNRKQQEGEPLIDFSHALMDLMDQVVKSDDQASIKSQKDLRDQFCEGVRDPSLRTRLQDLVKLNSEWTIREVRKEAIQWTTQCESQPFKLKPDHPRPVSNEVQAQTTVPGVSQSEFAELKSLMQAQLELVTKVLGPAKGNPSSNSWARSKRPSGSKPICFRCDQIGHIARYCLNPAPPKPAQTERREEGPQMQTPSEN